MASLFYWYCDIISISKRVAMLPPQLSSVVDPTSSTTVLDLSSGAELYAAHDEVS